MVLKLNRKYFLVVAFVLTTVFVFAQEEEMRPGDKDYKDKKQFERFNKKREAIGAWQINRLKEGALVVRLKTNQMLVNALLKNGDTTLAKEKEIEMAGINTNVIRAYFYNYTFSKVYFMYSNSTDSLLNGTRKNIFLDTNLVIDPSIVMTEKFYLIAERDYAYNSTIGFVKEDSAKFVKEEGYGVKEMALVVKNKYGHQLKKPFPYFTPDRPDIKLEAIHVVTIRIYGIPIPFNIGGLGRIRENKQQTAPDKRVEGFKYHNSNLTVYIPKYLTYDRLSLAISNFNEELKMYYRQNMNIGIERMHPEFKPFLY